MHNTVAPRLGIGKRCLSTGLSLIDEVNSIKYINIGPLRALCGLNVEAWFVARPIDSCVIMV